MAASISSWRSAMYRILPASMPSLIPRTAFRPQQPAAAAAAAAATVARTFHTHPALQGNPQSRKKAALGNKNAQFNRGGKTGASGGGRRGDKNRQADPKLALFQSVVRAARRAPAPLRMARNRYLRHWTIHRAWNLLRRQQREERKAVLMRQWQSMRAACEELRLLSGPGARDQGYLFRVAMEKKGVYGHNGVPIEYARPQTETPAREAWNHDWKR